MTITPKQEQFIVDYREQSLESVFLQRVNTTESAIFNGNYLRWQAQSPAQQCIKNAQKVLLLATPSLKNDELIQACQQQANAGVRIYLLLGSNTENHSAIQRLAGRCLIRSGITMVGSFMLSDPEDKLTVCWVGTDSLDSDTATWVRLLDTQERDYYRYFCHLFWEQAKEEYLEFNTKARTCAPSPLGEIPLNLTEQRLGEFFAMSKDWLGEEAEVCLSGYDNDWSNHVQENLQQACIVCPLEVSKKQELTKLAEQSGDLFLNETENMPDLLRNGEGQYWILPRQSKKNTWLWLLRLQDGQVEEAASLLTQINASARWQYHTTYPLGDVSTSLRFIDKLEDIKTIQIETEETLAEQYLDEFSEFEVMDSAKAKSYTEKLNRWTPNRLARQIKFKVAFHPPYLAREAKKDSLHKKWEEAVEKWQAGIKKSKAKLNEIEEREKGFGEKIRGLLRGLLTGNLQWKIEQKAILSKLDSFQGDKASSSECVKSLNELKHLYTNLLKRLGEVEEEADRAEQQIAWEQEKKTLENKLKDAEGSLQEKETALTNFEKNHKDEKEEREHLFLENWHKKVEEINWLKHIKQTKWVEFFPNNSSMQRIINEIKEAKEKDKTSLDTFKIQLMELSLEECKNLFEKKDFLNLCDKDVKEFLKKLSRDLLAAKQSSEAKREQYEKKLKTSKNEKQTVQKALDEHGDKFVYKSNKTKTNQSSLASLKDKNKQASTSDDGINVIWPLETLPEQSLVLYEHKNQRYLALDSWAQVEQAKNDAERLQAKLCVRKGNY